MPPVSSARQTLGVAACEAGANARPAKASVAAATTPVTLRDFFKFPPGLLSEMGVHTWNLCPSGSGA